MSTGNLIALANLLRNAVVSLVQRLTSLAQLLKGSLASA